MSSASGQNETYSDLNAGTAGLRGGAAALEGGPPYVVSGVAIPDNAVTHHASGQKVWTPDALRKAADTLADTSMSDRLLGDGQAVIDHSESARDSIGTVTKSGYVDDLGVAFEAELSDRQIAESIANGELEVSPRTMHTDDEFLETDDQGRHVVGGDDLTRLIHLSFDQSGRSPGNSVTMGPSDVLSDMSPRDISASLRKGNVVSRDRDGDGANANGANANGGDGQQVTDNSPSKFAMRASNADLRFAHRVTNPGDSGVESGGDDPTVAASTPESTVTELNAMRADETTDTMANPSDIDDDLEQYDDPVVIEEGTLSDLRAAKNQRSDDLEQQVSDLSAEIDELEGEMSVKEDKNEKLENQVDDLRAQVETFAGPVVEDLSDAIGLSAEKILDRNDADEIIAMAEAQGTTLPSDELNPRGGDPGGEPTDPDDPGVDAEDEEKLAELERKLGDAQQADMQGMVNHYEEQISDLSVSAEGGD